MDSMQARAPRSAFILAAGRGERLRPYTDQCPKPLVEIGGRAIIDHVIDRLVAANVQDVTVNLHYKADMLAAHLSKRKDIEIKLSVEDQLLDTGGGLANGLNLVENDLFYVLSGDWVWRDAAGGVPALYALADGWDAARMDLLLQLLPLERIPLTQAIGDYDISAGTGAVSPIVRSRERTGTHMWNSARICKKSLFEGCGAAPFSFLRLMDQAEELGRLYGMEAPAGEWHHISTAADLERVNRALSGAENQPVREVL